MGMAISFDPKGKPVEVEITPKNHYSPAVLTLRSEGQSVQLHLSDDVIADVAYAVNSHLDNIKYPQPVTPAAKEEIA
ncbi:hypothetical protein J2Z22_001630 [Paenibacillus forsythiae]|uniref:Uncharacterized protein n=1 Tax=Paenibacillus forsythiae TaxID=365616 RepID=A0ABU3H5V1_9BACL|nr:hypothetical protein [Paenibacillus forsythiae]MDT3426110.1 hypothetical protein [Paenibacillus forsythiae]